MRKSLFILLVCGSLFMVFSCATQYRARPLPFRLPSAYPNSMQAAGATVGAKAFVDSEEASQAFGFDIRGAGMLPVQVVFDNLGSHPLEIKASQTFLEDMEGNLWPVLSSKTAYERATKYAETKEIFKEGAYHGFLGAAGGAVIGAAVGIVTGESVAGSAGKGAAVGAAAGATLGGVKGFSSGDARQTIIDDLRSKTLQSKPIGPKSLAHGIIFFPGEARSARQLRLNLLEEDTGAVHILMLDFQESNKKALRN